MVKQVATSIPSPLIFDYPLKVMLRLFPDGTMMLFPEGIAPIPAPISISPNELANISQQLQEALADLAFSNEGAATFTHAEMETELRPLAELGNFAFQRIFADPDAQALMQNLPSGSTIEIVSENFILPWQLLYSADISAPIACTNFWGMQYILSHILIGTHHRRGPIVPPYIIIPWRPRVGLLSYNSLPAVAATEVPFFEALSRANRIRLVKLQPLNPNNKPQELHAFCNFWQQYTFDVAHFACHVSYNHTGPNLSEITLSDDFVITLQDMVTRRLQIYSHPLVIMNACETNNLNPLYSSHFAAWFLDQGVRGVVVTECKIPDTFAADFAQKLYYHLLNNEPVGKSLLTTRQHFWQVNNNPAGLVYSMYGPPMIQLVQQGELQ